MPKTKVLSGIISFTVHYAEIKSMEIVVDVTLKTYNAIAKIAESNGLNVEQWLQYHLEEEYGY